MYAGSVFSTLLFPPVPFFCLWLVVAGGSSRRNRPSAQRRSVASRRGAPRRRSGHSPPRPPCACALVVCLPAMSTAYKNPNPLIQADLKAGEGPAHCTWDPKRTDQKVSTDDQRDTNRRRREARGRRRVHSHAPWRSTLHGDRGPGVGGFSGCAAALWPDTASSRMDAGWTH